MNSSVVFIDDCEAIENNSTNNNSNSTIAVVVAINEENNVLKSSSTTVNDRQQQQQKCTSLVVPIDIDAATMLKQLSKKTMIIGLLQSNGVSNWKSTPDLFVDVQQPTVEQVETVSNSKKKRKRSQSTTTNNKQQQQVKKNRKIVVFLKTILCKVNREITQCVCVFDSNSTFYWLSLDATKNRQVVIDLIESTVERKIIFDIRSFFKLFPHSTVIIIFFFVNFFLFLFQQTITKQRRNDILS